MPKRSYGSYAPAKRRKMSRPERWANGVATAAAIANRMYQLTKTITRTRKDEQAPGTTGQFDWRTLYTRKRAPKRVRRYAKRMAWKCRRNALNDASSRTNLFSNHKGSIGAAIDNQRVFSITSGYKFCAGGTHGADKVGSIYDVIQNISNAAPSAGSSDYYLTHMSMDYTITNTGGHTMELDVYDWVCRKSHEFTLTAAEVTALWDVSVTSVLGNASDSEPKLPGATNTYGFNVVGWVPTDANQAMKYILIKRKTRYYIAAGSTISFVRRIKFRRPIKFASADFKEWDNPSSLPSDTLEMRSGVTRGIICIAKGVPDNSNLCLASDCAYNAQTRYTMKQLDYSTNQQGLNF